MRVKSVFETQPPDVALFVAGVELDQFLAAEGFDARTEPDLGKWLPDRLAKLALALLRRAEAVGAVSAARMQADPAYARAQFEVLGLYLLSFVARLAELHRVDPKALGACAMRDLLTMAGVQRFERPALGAAMVAYFDASARVETAQKILFVFTKWYGLFAEPVFARLEESHRFLARQAIAAAA